MKKVSLAHKTSGFTLVELLVVMSILGVLATLIAGGFRSAQARGRDAARKGDLKEISNSLELFYQDYGRYPADSSGSIGACSFDPALRTGSPCVWGTGEFTDGKTVYFKVLPNDPSKNQDYFYRTIPGSANQKYQVFTQLENTKDQSCLGGDCENPPVSYLCGSGVCNFAVTSSNTTATE